MSVTRQQLAGIMDPGHKAYQDRFFDVMKAQEVLWPAVFRLRNPGERGDNTIYRVSDVAYIPRRDDEEGIIEERKYQEDGSVTFTHAEYVAKFTAPKATWEDMPADMRSGFADLYAISAQSTKENVAWGVFRDAFTGTTYTGPDGKALCADDHTLKSGDTADNKGTSALSVSSINAARAATMRLKTSQGRVQIGPMARYLVVPPEKEADAKTFTGANNYGLWPTGGGGAGQSADYNFASQQGLTVLSVPYLTDVNDWFLVVDPSAQMQGLALYDREQPMFQAAFNEENHYYWGKLAMRFSVGFENWRGVWGSSDSA